MKTTINTIPHNTQPYDTAGDWRRGADGEVHINVSGLGNEDYEFLVGIHELVEEYLCRKRGISTQQVDEFDREFEKQREKSITLDTSEPGDNRFAPYQNEHCIATGIERVMAAALGVKWQDYETAINSL